MRPSSVVFNGPASARRNIRRPFGLGLGAAMKRVGYYPSSNDNAVRAGNSIDVGSFLSSPSTQCEIGMRRIRAVHPCCVSWGSVRWI